MEGACKQTPRQVQTGHGRHTWAFFWYEPAPFEDNRLGLENTFWLLSEPVGLTSIGTMVQDKHEVRITGQHATRRAGEAAGDAHVTSKPDLVGTTAMTTDAYQAKAVMMLAKQILPSCLTVMGGHHATFMPEFYDEAYVDVVVQGEGELTFQDLVDTWSGALAVEAEPSTQVLATLRALESTCRTERGPRAASPRAWAEIDDFPAPDHRADRAVPGAVLLPRSQAAREHLHLSRLQL